MKVGERYRATHPRWSRAKFTPESEFAGTGYQDLIDQAHAHSQLAQLGRLREQVVAQGGWGVFHILTKEQSPGWGQLTVQHARQVALGDERKWLIEDPETGSVAFAGDPWYGHVWRGGESLELSPQGSPESDYYGKRYLWAFVVSPVVLIDMVPIFAHSPAPRLLPNWDWADEADGPYFTSSAEAVADLHTRHVVSPEAP